MTNSSKTILFGITTLIVFTLLAGYYLFSGTTESENTTSQLSAADTLVPAEPDEKRTELIDSISSPYDTINKQILITELFDSAGMIGKNVLITVGGLGAKLKWVEAWTKELYRQKLKEFNIGLVCIVMGPKEEYYDSREIAIPKLAKKYLKSYEKYRLNETYLIVHSSGVFPAHQMFDLLYTGSVDSNKYKGKRKPATNYDSLEITKNKIVYIVLDGEPGRPSGYTITNAMATNLKKIISVYAKDEKTGTKSGMYNEAIKLKKLFPGKTEDYFLKSINSGCNKGAKWCVHETVITTKPHNPAMYDLERDYQYFSGERKVVTEYMDFVKSILAKE